MMMMMMILGSGAEPKQWRTMPKSNSAENKEQFRTLSASRLP